MPRDLPSAMAYYPRVGKENHALGYPWRFGVWLDGEFSWLDRDNWTLERAYLPDTLVTAVTASHHRLPLRLHFNDTVNYEKNILLRQVRVQNLAGKALEPRLFFHTDINALEDEIGDTVFFDPRNGCLLHYKGPRYFMMGRIAQSRGNWARARAEFEQAVALEDKLPTRSRPTGTTPCASRWAPCCWPPQRAVSSSRHGSAPKRRTTPGLIVRRERLTTESRFRRSGRSGRSFPA